MNETGVIVDFYHLQSTCANLCNITFEWYCTLTFLCSIISSEQGVVINLLICGGHYVK